MSDDVHDHRRQGDNDDSMGHRMETAADSTLAKWLARIVMPMMLAIIGWFLMQANARIEGTQATQGKDIASIKSDVRDVNTRLDSMVIRQVDQNSKTVSDHEKRLQTLERIVRTP